MVDDDDVSLGAVAEFQPAAITQHADGLDDDRIQILKSPHRRPNQNLVADRRQADDATTMAQDMKQRRQQGQFNLRPRTHLRNAARHRLSQLRLPHRRRQPAPMTKTAATITLVRSRETLRPPAKGLGQRFSFHAGTSRAQLSPFLLYRHCPNTLWLFQFRSHVRSSANCQP